MPISDRRYPPAAALGDVPAGLQVADSDATFLCEEGAFEIAWPGGPDVGSDFHMYLSNDDHKKLIEKIEVIGDRVTRVEAVAALQKPKGGWKEYIGLATVALAVVGGAIQLNTRITKIQSALTVITNQQSDQTQRLIRDLLASASTTPNSPMATKILGIATQLTSTLREEKRPASPQFFQEAIESASKNNSPELIASLLKLQTQLAEYRSALQPNVPVGAADFHCPPNFPDKSAFGGFHDKVSIKDLTIRDCPQILDGYIWKNIVFVNSTIKYRGGVLHLQNVTFVNCTFDVQESQDGASVLQYAALEKDELSIGRLPQAPQG